MRLIAGSPGEYGALKEQARKGALEDSGWDRVIEDVFGEHPGGEAAGRAVAVKTGSAAGA